MQRLQLWFLCQGTTVLIHSYQKDREPSKLSAYFHIFYRNRNSFLNGTLIKWFRFLRIKECIIILCFNKFSKALQLIHCKTYNQLMFPMEDRCQMLASLKVRNLDFNYIQRVKCHSWWIKVIICQTLKSWLKQLSR